MGYVKALIYGQNLELYTYEKNIAPIGGKKQGNASRANRKGMAKDGELSPQQIQQVKIKREDNSRRAGMAFRRLVLANISESHAPLLVTCTYSQNQTNIGVAYKDWHSFIRNLRNSYGGEFKYVVVPEFQKRGAVHFHALFWGLPENTGKEERRTRMVAKHWRLGFVDVYQTDGNEKIAWYISKYMVKGYTDHRLFGKKVYRCSRNIIRPVVELNLGGMQYLEHCYGLGVDNPPLQDVSFQTKWLGKGRFRLYKLIPNSNGNPNKSYLSNSRV